MKILFVCNLPQERHTIFVCLEKFLHSQGVQHANVKVLSYGKFLEDAERESPNVVFLDVDFAGGSPRIFAACKTLKSKPRLLCLYPAYSPEAVALILGQGADACLMLSSQQLGDKKLITEFLEQNLFEPEPESVPEHQPDREFAVA